jgi:hypothetical protein
VAKAPPDVSRSQTDGKHGGDDVDALAAELGLARYITRPPVAQERLSLRPDGKLLLEFTRAFGASARRGSPNVYLRGLRPAYWTPSTPVQESLEGRHSRSGALARRPVGASVRGSRAATLSHAALFRRAQ